MKLVLIFLAIIAIGHGQDGFRAKYGNGTTEAEADAKNYFFKLPKTISEAKVANYSEVKDFLDKKNTTNLVMYCAPGYVICPLYIQINETLDILAGLQVAVPKTAINDKLYPEKYFKEWKISDTETFWTATQYYFTKESLEKGNVPSTTNTTYTIQDHGVWVKSVQRNQVGEQLTHIPVHETQLKDTNFKKQNCIPNMGTHYYYNMTKDLSCDEPLLPWFPLFTNGKLIGVGFQTFGDKSKVKVEDTQVDWFEDIPRTPRDTPKKAIPHAPECFLDKSEQYGRLSIHIYFIDKPWELKCKPEDSVEPELPATTTPKPTKKSKSFANPTADLVQNAVLMAFSLLLLAVSL